MAGSLNPHKTIQHAESPQTCNEVAADRPTADFNNKIIHIVRSSLAKIPEFNDQISYDIGLEGLPQILDSSKPIPIRNAWVLVIFACLTTCVFQIYSCGVKYYAQPIAVDVEIREQEELVFPSVTIVNTESDGLYSMYNKASPNKSIQVGVQSCYNPVRELIDIAKGVNVEEMWRHLNSSETIINMKLVTRNEEYPVTTVEEFGLVGLQTRIQVGNTIKYGGIHTKYVGDIRKIVDGCDNSQILGSFQDNEMPSDMRTIWTFRSQLSLDITFTMQKFEFVSRRVEPCVDRKTYFHCRDQCAVEVFKNFPCRFPFLPKQIDLPTCVAGSNEVGDIFAQTLFAFGKMRCKCPRMCQETTFSVYVNSAGETLNVTSVSASFANNIMTVTKERFAYDFISLLSDIGGSLGLCLGFSLLSFVQFLQGVIKIVYYRKNQMQNRLKPRVFFTDAVINKIHQILQDELQRFRLSKTTFTSKFPIAGFGTVMEAGAKPFLRVGWLLVILTCFISYCVFIYIRVSLYLSHPTQMKVEITKTDTVQFPTITICGNNITAINIFRKIAKKKKLRRRLPSGNEMLDWCSFHLTDLLDIRGINAQLAWEVSSVTGEFERAQNVGEFLSKRELLENVVHRSVYLPDGKCSEFNIGQQDYSGTNTLFSKLTISKVDISNFHDEVIECGRSYNTIYFTPPNGILQLNTRVTYPKVTKAIFILESKKVTLLNLRRKPCTDPVSENECLIRCFEKMLSEQITCRLPYMPIFANITSCSNSTFGKEAHKIFMELSLTMNPFSPKTCNCIPSCTKTLVFHVLYVEPLDVLKMSFVGSLFFTNIQHHIMEETADSLPNLLCDLGGNLGLMLGLSLLSIFDIIQSLGSLIKFKRNEHH